MQDIPVTDIVLIPDQRKNSVSSVTSRGNYQHLNCQLWLPPLRPKAAK